MSESSNQQASRSPSPDEWRNRIIGSGGMRAGDFLANPHNWRIHPKNQQDGLAGVLDTVGWVQEVIVNQRTGFLVDGHLRVTLALRKGEDTAVPVKYVDLSEEEEALILAALDPIAAMAATDRAKLDEVMRMANSDNAAVQAMMETIAIREGLMSPEIDYAAEWAGMPEFEQEDKTSYQSIHVHFKNAEEVVEFGKLINQSLTKNTRSIWYSEREQMDTKTEQYADVS